MRTSLTETEEIEKYLLHVSEPGEALVFEARLLIEPDMKDKLIWQQKTYRLVKAYGRLQLKKEIEAVHHQLFSLPEHTGFRQKIMRIFSK